MLLVDSEIPKTSKRRIVGLSVEVLSRCSIKPKGKLIIARQGEVDNSLVLSSKQVMVLSNNEIHGTILVDRSRTRLDPCAFPDAV